MQERRIIKKKRNLTQFTETHDQGGVQARYFYNNMQNS